MKLSDFDILVYDFEVFAHDWLVVFVDPSTGSETHFWNEDAGELAGFMDERADTVFASFNGSHYDKWIMKAIRAGCSPEEVKEINDRIITSDEPIWEHPYLQGRFWDFADVDLMKDMQLGTSLKSIESHMGLSVEESSVDFTVDHPLSPSEREEVLGYCVHDVEATCEVLKARDGYLETKLALGERAGIEPAKALAMTNAKLTAAVLGAQAVERDDERAYAYPENLDRSAIPEEVFAFFDRMGDPSVPDEELWSSKLELEVGGCPVTLGFGGIHGALPCHLEEASEARRVVNADVSSYYPSLMVVNGYTSRNMASPETFERIYRERLEAKAAGDKATADALKLVVNTTYGATLNQYNPLYDPLMARSVCVSGQLYLLELACRLVADVGSLTLVQLNTDGILVSYDEPDGDAFRAICEEWCSRTGFALEYDDVTRIWQRDVNNYAMRMSDGHEKVKGGRLVRGQSRAGAYSINNDATAVADALRAYLLDGVPVRETLEACEDPRRYQLTAKAGSKFSRVYQIVGGEEVERQRCNRVFAARDGRLGTLYKVKRENGQIVKMAGLPDCCLVANGAYPAMADIDREWYIALAERWAQEFEPKGEEMATAAKKEAPTEGLNVYQKLARARAMFQERAGAKSGVNLDQGWSFVELEDIVPHQTAIFAELGLVEVFSYHEEPAFEESRVEEGSEGARTAVNTYRFNAYAKSTVVNADAPEQTVEFRLPWSEIEPIVSGKTGKAIDNALQRTGKEQTYLRRYIKMQILDVALPDTVDRGEKAPGAPKPQAAPAKPATAEERRETASALADPGAPATQLQVRQLKKAVKTLKDAHPTSAEAGAAVAELGVATHELAEITKKQAEEWIIRLGELKQKLDAGE